MPKAGSREKVMGVTKISTIHHPGNKNVLSKFDTAIAWPFLFWKYVGVGLQLDGRTDSRTDRVAILLSQLG